MAPSDETLKKVQYYLSVGLACAAEDGSINNKLRQILGDKYGDFARYIPVRTVKYLHDIDFRVDDLPSLARDDYPKFFKKMQEEKYTATSEYIEHMRNAAIPLEQRETIEVDQPGFLYCFISNFTASTKGYCVVKVGRTKRAIDRVLAHRSVMVEHQVVYLTHSPYSLSNEKKLIEYFEHASLSRPFYDPKSKRKSAEMFELPALYVPQMFADVISKLQCS
jgi:hypothetical protein